MVRGGNTHGNKRVCVSGDGECQTEEVEREKGILSFLFQQRMQLESCCENY